MVERTITGEQRRHPGRWWAPGLALAAALAGGGTVAVGALTGQPRAARATVAPRPVPVGTATLERQSSRTTVVEYLGTVRSPRSGRVGAERAGRVVKVHVEEGQRVKRGDVLATLDAAADRAQLRRLRAELARGQAGERLAAITKDRVTRLLAADATPRATLDDARAQLDGAQAGLDATRAAMAGVLVRLRQAVVRAPFAGTVAERFVVAGDVVAPGAPVVRFLEERPPEATLGVPLAVAAELEPGGPVELRYRSAGTDRTLAGKVQRVVRDVSAATRTVTVIVQLPEGAPAPGTVVRWPLKRVHQEAGTWVPTEALRVGPRGLFRILRVTDEGAVAAELVRVLHTDGERSYVDGTLPAAARVVVAGAHKVVPGQRVTVSAARPTAASGNDAGAP